MGSWSLSSFAQHLDSILVDNHYYPAPTLANLIIMANSKNMDWESQMKKFDFDTSRFAGSGEIFENGTNNSLYAVFKQPKQTTIVWSTTNSKIPINILDSIKDDLTPFYITIGKNITYYKFKILGDQYIVGINRKNNEEMIKLIKQFPAQGRTIEYPVDSIDVFPDGKPVPSSGMVFLEDGWPEITFLGLPFKGSHSFKIIKSEVTPFSGDSANGMALSFDLLSSKGVKGSVMISNAYHRLIFFSSHDSYGMQLRY